MIRKKDASKIVIDIDGPEGNAFALLGYAKRFADDLGIESEPIIEEMQSGDYINLIKVFNFNFPMVIIETNQEDLLKEFE